MLRKLSFISAVIDILDENTPLICILINLVLGLSLDLARSPSAANLRSSFNECSRWLLLFLSATIFNSMIAYENDYINLLPARRCYDRLHQ